MIAPWSYCCRQIGVEQGSGSADRSRSPRAPLSSRLWPRAKQYIFALLFVWIAVVAAILSYGIGRGIPTVALIWPGFGVVWFGTAGRPDDALAVVSFAHQRLQYEITQIVPLAVLLAIGVLFYV